jgi:hypothetical protein
MNIKLTYLLCCWAFSFAQLSITSGMALCWESFHPEIACQTTLQLHTSKKTLLPSHLSKLGNAIFNTYSKCLTRVVRFRPFVLVFLLLLLLLFFGLYHLYSRIGVIYNCSTMNNGYTVFAIYESNWYIFHMCDLSLCAIELFALNHRIMLKICRFDPWL